MSTTIKAIKAKAPRVQAARLALLNELRSVGKEIQNDYKATTATWKHKPEFKTQISLAGGTPSVSVSTTDKIFGYVDAGTRPHIIAPRAKRLRFMSGFSAKTSPGVLGSGAGGASGDMVFARVVHHPGTKARGFSKIILNKWRGQFGKRMLTAMKKAAQATGHAR